MHNNRLDTLKGKYVNIEDAGNNPGVGKVLATLMGGNYQQFVDRFQVVSPATIEGRYLVADGCMPHACNMQYSFLAIDLRTKRISAAVAVDGRMYFYGENASNPSSMCAPLLKWARNNGVEI